MRWSVCSVAVAGLLAVASAVAASESRTARLANPAAVFCVEQGGRYEIRISDDGGQQGFRVLPDGTETDAWTYFCEQSDGGTR